MNIEQHAAEIAAQYTREELRLLYSTLRRHLERRQTVLNRRLPDYVVRVPRQEQTVKLGPVSAVE